jgi:hypothetical protein
MSEEKETGEDPEDEGNEDEEDYSRDSGSQDAAGSDLTVFTVKSCMKNNAATML